MTTTETHAKKVASETAEKIAAAGKETLETVMKMGADATAESYKNATAFGREQLHMTRDSCSKATVYGKDNLDAMSESAAAVVAGWEAYYAGVGRLHQERDGRAHGHGTAIFHGKDTAGAHGPAG